VLVVHFNSAAEATSDAHVIVQRLTDSGVLSPNGPAQERHE
jgi:hypothetical protein